MSTAASEAVDPHEVFGTQLRLIENQAPARNFGRIAKRSLDVAVVLVLLLLLAPALALIAIAIKLDDGGPVFYRQQRVGKGNNVFSMFKFRSMVQNADQMTDELADRNMHDGLLFKVAHDPRTTRVGRTLRRLSIDELPQLFNVLTGDMSLVGPRPLPVDPESFTAVERVRHRVQPGMTGLWQVSGGNDLPYDAMINLDLTYVRQWTFFEDVRILVRTPLALVHRFRRGHC